MDPSPKVGVTATPFGKTADGQPVERYTFRNRNGFAFSVMTYGATLISVEAPDRAGKLAEVTLGFDTLDGYLKGHPFFGSTVGRVANRIGNAKFTLDGKTYTLAANNGPNTLHGGKVGFDKKVWAAKVLGDHAVRFTHTSPDGDEGFPGTLAVAVTFTLSPANEVQIDYEATTDKATPVNLTNHAYFNLTGDYSKSITGHVVKLHADKYTPGDATLIPTGELKDVAGTPYDFREPKEVKKDLGQTAGEPPGYDTNFVLRSQDKTLATAAEVFEPTTGRVLTVRTTEPGIQFYTGNFLDGTLAGRGSVKVARHAGFCLEAQNFPDAVNKPTFPNAVLKPGETYKQRTVYAFGVR